MEETLSINRYVLGDKRFSLDDIAENPAWSMSVNSDEVLDFFKWIKKYNSRTNKKVRIFGVGFPKVELTYHLYLFDYLCKLSGASPTDILAYRLAETTLTDNFMLSTLKTFENDGMIKLPDGDSELIGKQFEMMKLVLNESESAQRSDSLMAVMAQFIINRYCKPDETAIVKAHIMQVCNSRSSVDKILSPSCGSYLKESKTVKYESRAILVGNGRNMVRKLTGPIIQELPSLPDNSVEKLLLDEKAKDRYLSVMYIPDRVLGFRLENTSVSLDHLSDLADEFYFIADSKPSSIINNKKTYEEKAIKISHDIQQYMSLIQPSNN